MTSRVLIIDDNAALAESLRETLEKEPSLDVKVRVCHDAGSGRAWAEIEGFDVAIVEVRLPDASGVELVRPLRALCPLSEVIVVTGVATVDSAIATVQAGAFSFVLKSSRPEELTATLRQALAKVAFKREREEFQLRSRSLIDAADVFILGLDHDGTIDLFNKRLTELTGLSTERARGTQFIDLVEESDREAMWNAIVTAAKGEGKTEVEVSIHGVHSPSRPPRRVRFHLSNGQAINAPKPQVYGLGIDVTERRTLERRAAAAEALNAMAPLAMGLAHEIRNPLNAAVLQLELLGRSIDRLGDPGVRDPMRERVGIVKSEIGRLGRLLGEFLELARPRAAQREETDVSRVAGEVLELEAEAIQRRGVRVERDLPAGLSALTDVEKLKQIILNIIVNALEAMPDGGTLTVRVVPESSERLCLEIGDTGPGIDPAIFAEIFDPFFTTKPAGTGLGLAIVRKLAEQLGGTVTLDSRLGKGTKAQVWLPRAGA